MYIGWFTNWLSIVIITNCKTANTRNKHRPPLLDWGVADRGEGVLSSKLLLRTFPGWIDDMWFAALVVSPVRTSWLVFPQCAASTEFSQTLFMLFPLLERWSSPRKATPKEALRATPKETPRATPRATPKATIQPSSTPSTPSVVSFQVQGGHPTPKLGLLQGSIEVLALEQRLRVRGAVIVENHSENWTKSVSTSTSAQG